MPRCPLVLTAALALSLPLLAPLNAQAQYTRVLPPNTLRGEVAFVQPPEATLNGDAIRMAPGVRIRGSNNMLMVMGALAGQTLKVNYTLEATGLLRDIWVLTDDEAAKAWPKSIQEAAVWSYNPIAQSWSKP